MHFCNSAIYLHMSAIVLRNVIVYELKTDSIQQTWQGKILKNIHFTQINCIKLCRRKNKMTRVC